MVQSINISNGFFYNLYLPKAFHHHHILDSCFFLFTFVKSSLSPKAGTIVFSLLYSLLKEHFLDFLDEESSKVSKSSSAANKG